ADALESSQPDELPAGPYVLLLVRDTGCGMSEEEKARIFEPFFTTKEVGKGSGLGLASVYGSIKQSGGFIGGENQVNVGSAFTIYLPRLAESPLSEPPKMDAGHLPRGSETILLVEDAEEVRKLTRKMLESAGYAVVEAENGTLALEIAKQRQGPIQLL